MKSNTLALLDELKFAVREQGNQFTHPTDDWSPMLFCLNKRGQFSVTPLAYSDDEEKDLVFHIAIPTIIAKTNATSVVTLVSAWMVDLPKPEQSDWRAELPDIRPSQHPARKEILMLTAYDSEGDVAAIAEISRNGTRPQLDAWVMRDENVISTGRLHDPIVTAVMLNAQQGGVG